GHTPARRLNYWGMPWMVLGSLSEADALAMAGYLKTLPAVRNRVPLPLHYGFLETVLRKLAYPWPALVPERLSYYPGNFCSEVPPAIPRDRPQRVLIWAQLILLTVAVAAFLFAPRPARTTDSPLRGLSTIVTVLVLIASGVAIVIYHYPALDKLPTQTVVT